jgi:hypothetical protein
LKYFFEAIKVWICGIIFSFMKLYHVELFFFLRPFMPRALGMVRSWHLDLAYSSLPSCHQVRSCLDLLIFYENWFLAITFKTFLKKPRWE